jgi:hypothetical protein
VFILLIWDALELDRQDIEAIAVRVAQLLAWPSSGPKLLDPQELAREIGVSVDYVYAHAAELGGMRLGDGPKARLRFELHTAKAAMRQRERERSEMPRRR